MIKKISLFLIIILLGGLLTTAEGLSTLAAFQTTPTPTPSPDGDDETHSGPNPFVASWFGEDTGSTVYGEEIPVSTTLPTQVFPPGVPAAVTNGLSYSCALTSTGGVRCWGGNVWGQLGNGTFVNQTKPTDVVGLTSGVTQVSTLHKHVCALTHTGGVKCWGRNYHGELGNNSNVNSPYPVDVVGLQSGVTQISVGGFHACALLATGRVMCWGYNFHGQLGDGSYGAYADRWIPVEVKNVTDATAVAAGKYHTCAITESDGLRCWGYNNDGQIGDGTFGTDRHTSVGVSDMDHGVVAISLGERHSCALMDTGALRCWGGNQEGQLGDGTTVQHERPVAVVGLSSGVSAMAAGIYHTCAITTGGALKCWGYNWAGQIGDNTQVNRLSPANVSGLSSGVVDVAGGDSHTCAVVKDQVECWGSNGFGQIGDGKSALRLSPTNTTGLTSDIIAVAAGNLHTCILTVSGAVKCWGDNTFGQLGDGTNITRLVPVEVVGLGKPVTAIAAGWYHTCAMLSGGMKCWGSNASGQIGDGSVTNRLVPTDVVSLENDVASVQAGGLTTCAQSQTGQVKCWGDNWTGQLGNGATYARSIPVDVTDLPSGILALAVGGMHTCAVTDGGVLCWGSNSNGQIGDNTLPWQLTSTAVKHWFPATLISNHATGQPGSFFTFTGAMYTPDITATIRINSVVLSQTVTVDDAGGLIFQLHSAQADPGHYVVTAATTEEAVGAWFLLDPTAPPQPQLAPVFFEIPAGIAYNYLNFLPVVLR